MPKRVETYKPPWLARRRREARPTAAARGYCTPEWRRTRLAVIARDGGICQICGALITEGRVDIDHKLPKARGGTDNMDNLQTCHAACHSRKTVREDS